MLEIALLESACCCSARNALLTSDAAALAVLRWKHACQAHVFGRCCRQSSAHERAVTTSHVCVSFQMQYYDESRKLLAEQAAAGPGTPQATAAGPVAARP